MSVFAPRFYNQPSFSGLFRLIDEFDKYAGQNDKGDNSAIRRPGSHQPLSTFHAKFDVKETEAAYELHGDLPGVKKEDLNIEFTDDQTIRVFGRVERHYTDGDGDSPKVEDAKNTNHTEEERENKSTQVVKPSDKDKEVGSSAPKARYWVTERSVGEFSRIFSFPTQVDRDAITAKLENGVLTVVVPKAKKTEGRRITIN
ncbi:putative Small heat shock protein [Seiridium cardinale]|uniref:Small heat shock protein n=1 Tax=Seiridium cardinale TaxID=138064 RepID=A0ABR2XR58_9PEZI